MNLIIYSIPPNEFPLILTGFLTAIALIIVVLSVTGNKSRYAAAGLASFGFIASIAFIILQAEGYFGPTGTAPNSSSLLAVDWLSYIFGVSILIASLLVGLTAVDYFAEITGTDVTTFYALIIFTTIGALLLAFSANLLMMFVAWELMSIPSYILTGFKKKDTASNEAAVKYFIISAFASAVLLYGISLIYALTGSLSIYGNAVLSGTHGYEALGFLALTFVVAGFGIKLAAVPFHMWIPDAYQGAPTIVSALLSTATKGATFAPAIRVLFVIFGSGTSFQPDWALTFAILAVLSMTLGNFAALTQRSVTRILAYSSIGQAGYIMIGFAVTSFSTQEATLGLTGSFLHILNYASMQTCAFLAAALIIKRVGTDSLDGLNGVGKRMSIAPLALTLSLLALAGMPPLNGFWGKFILFLAAFQTPNLEWLAIVGIINSFVSVAFYVRIIKHMYVDKGTSTIKLIESNGFKIALIIAAIIIIVTGIYPWPFIEFANKAATNFLAGF